MKLIFQHAVSFIFGVIVCGIIFVFSAVNKSGHDAIKLMHYSVYNYEMAVQQASRDEIIARLNSSISCAINGYEDVKNTIFHLGFDDSYSHIIEKAYGLKKKPCNYPFSDKPD